MQEYKKTEWVNDSEPYINAENLNNIEQGIEAVTNEVTEIEESLTEYAKKSDIPSDTVTHEEITETLEEYAKKGDIPADTVNHTELQEYAKKTELPDLTPYAKTEAVTALETELETKADKDAIPTALPTPNTLTITLNGTEYSFDGSTPVALNFENAETKYY